MSKVGHGYGSEWHLLRYLGWQRHELDRRVGHAIGGEVIEWLDFPFGAGKESFYHAEWEGVDFLWVNHSARKQWARRWPAGRTAPCWDAVGRVRVRGQEEWLLVEAKARTGEISAASKASDPRSLEQIGSLLNDAREACSISAAHDWMGTCYQFCNRLAVLNFLTRHEVPARLLFVYFIGDEFPTGSADCPQSEERWRVALDEMHAKAGWPGDGRLQDRVHELFLPMRG